MAKHRLLVVGEFSKLHTGFSMYCYHLMSELYKTGKYEIAEYSSYIRTHDSRAMEVPWKVYGVMPDDPSQDAQFNSNPNNQFGAAKFDSVLLDFKPHTVLSVRDPWFDSFINQSVYRPFFNFVWMTTADSEPFRQEWLDDLKNCDAVLTYSDYGKKVLETQTGGKLKVAAVPYCGCETKLVHPHKDKNEAKHNLNLESDTIIFGTVMRNQPRKLFPELFKSFGRYLQLCVENGREDLAAKSFLHCHTCVVDVGWNIPLELKRSKISHKVLFTYACQNCKYIRPQFYQGEICVCPRCNKPGFITPGSSNGITREQLLYTMGAWDAYIQFAVCEGWGIGQSDAKLMGVPTLGGDYSATGDLSNEPGGLAIKINEFFQEPLQMTYQIRSYPDNEDAAQKMFLLASDDELRNKIGREGRKLAEEKYDWEIVASRWMGVLDSLPVKNESDTWLSPPRINQGHFQIPDNLTNEAFVAYLWGQVAKEPNKLGSPLYHKHINLLNLGYEIVTDQGGRVNQHPIDRNVIVNWFINYVNRKNQAEVARAQRLLSPQQNNVLIAEV